MFRFESKDTNEISPCPNMSLLITKASFTFSDAALNFGSPESGSFGGVRGPRLGGLPSSPSFSDFRVVLGAFLS